MKPKKTNILIKPLAEKHDVSEALVKDITGFYWKRVKDALVHCEHGFIFVSGFGTFSPKPVALRIAITKYKSITDKYKGITESGRKITFQKYAIWKDCEARLDELMVLQNALYNEKERKSLTKRKREAKNKANT